MQHGLGYILEDPAGGRRGIVEHRPRLLGGTGPPLRRSLDVALEQLPGHAERELALQVLARAVSTVNPAARATR